MDAEMLLRNPKAGLVESMADFSGLIGKSVSGLYATGSRTQTVPHSQMSSNGYEQIPVKGPILGAHLGSMGVEAHVHDLQTNKIRSIALHHLTMEPVVMAAPAAPAAPTAKAEPAAEKPAASAPEKQTP